jgi:hypothetical protein
MDLTEAQWAVIAPMLPEPKVREDGRGRPWRDPRDILNGVLYDEPQREGEEGNKVRGPAAAQRACSTD